MAARSEAGAADADGGTRQLIHWFLRSDRCWAAAHRDGCTPRFHAPPPVRLRAERQLMHFLSAGPDLVFKTPERCGVQVQRPNHHTVARGRGGVSRRFLKHGVAT